MSWGLGYMPLRKSSRGGRVIIFDKCVKTRDEPSLLNGRGRQRDGGVHDRDTQM